MNHVNDGTTNETGTLQVGFKVRLERLEGTKKKSPLRTAEVEGFCNFLPIVGNTWKMYAEPLETDKDIRFIETSVVEKYVEFDLPLIIFKTKNSIYKLTVFF